MRNFRITDRIEIVCDYAPRVRDGFTHVATLLLDGRQVDSARAHYINRSWESYEFQSVMQKLIDKTTALTPKEKQFCKNWIRGDRTDWSDFNMVSNVAKLGDVLMTNKKDKNKFKTNILKAGLGNKGLDIPEGFANLPEATKEARLNKVLDVLSSKGKKGKAHSQLNDMVKRETDIGRFV